MRRFLRRIPEGGGQFAFNPLSLSWELLLDSRQIAPLPDGTIIPAWPDISGNGRSATSVPGFEPKYRSGVLKSPTGLPLADFNWTTNTQMFGTLPPGGVGNTQGFSFYTWYILDSVPSAGGGDSQLVLADDIVNGFRLFASRFIGVGDMETQMLFTNTITGSTATLGIHTLTCICTPPSGVGTMEIFHDGVSVAPPVVWSGNPQTQYLVSGNSVQNIWLRGRLGFVGFGKRVDSTATRQQMEAYLRRTWG